MRISSLRKIPGRPKLFKSDYGYILVVGLEHPPDHMAHELSAIVPSDIVASLRHLVLAALRASRSLKKGVNIADVFAYELGICLTGDREISKVISVIRRRDYRKGYTLVAVCENPLECRSMLMNILMRGAMLGNVRALYEPESFPICSNIEDIPAMGKGALVELDR